MSLMKNPVSQPMQFLQVNVFNFLFLGMILGLIIFFTHLLDLYAWSFLELDSLNPDSNFLMKILFFIIFAILLWVFASLFSLLAVPLYLPLYPYTLELDMNRIYPLTEFEFIYKSDWILSIWLNSSIIFWVAFVVLFFLAFKEESWKNFYSKYRRVFLDDDKYEEHLDKPKWLTKFSLKKDITERLDVENKTQALKDLKRLLDDGAISSEEFNKLKRELLE